MEQEKPYIWGWNRFDRVQKTFNFAGQQPPQGAKLKINDNTVVTLHPALLAVLGQRAVAWDSDKYLLFGLTCRTEIE